MPDRIVVVLNDATLADATVAALKDSDYDAMTVHDPMTALTMLEQAKEIELLVISTNFAEGKPNGLAIARMTRIKRPKLKVIFAGDPTLAELVEDIGHLIAEPISPPQLVEVATVALAS